jgi:hypothetical protein
MINENVSSASDDNNVRQLCASCSTRLAPDAPPAADHITLWHFNPYIHDTYAGLKSALSEFINASPLSPAFYNTYNEDGYTYAQWQIYYLARNVFKFRQHHRPTLWLFQILSRYPFFHDMIRQGSRDDPTYHTLLHFSKYTEKVGHLQRHMIDLLVSNGLSMDDEDAEGISARLYLLQKQMHPDDIKRANQLTRAYKKMEDALFDRIKDHLRRCDVCQEPVAKYEDLTTVVQSQTVEISNTELAQIMQYRDECNMIYRLYGDHHNASIQRHQYIVDIYQGLLSAVPPARDGVR